MVVAKLKALLRTAAARTVPGLWAAIRQTFTRFKPDECRTCLTAAGYDACDPACEVTALAGVNDGNRQMVAILSAVLSDGLALLSRKSALAEAIGYATSRWAGLTLFVEDGRVEIDFSTVERAIYPMALSRKNALFAGSDHGGEHWAVIASLVETCKLNGVDPQGYLADVIARIVGDHPQRRIDDLLPWAYPTIPGLKTAP